MLKRFKRFACLLLAGVFLLSGCSDQTEKVKMGAEVGEPLYSWGNVNGKTLTVWGEDGSLQLPYVTKAFKRYEELTGNTFQLVGFSKLELVEKLSQAYSSDSAPRPDLLLSFSETSLERLNPSENFYDFTNAPWIDDLTDTALNQSIFDGKVIGFPYNEAAISGTLYNKEIFKKYNLEIPKTQKEFLQVCEKLHQSGVTPVYLPYADITMLLYQFPMSSFLQDRKILDGLNDGSLSYSDIPEMRLIVEWYKTMSDRGYFGKDYLGNNWDGMDGAMKSGDYAMMLCWDTWLYDVFTGDASKFGLMPAFVGTPEKGGFEGPNMLVFIADKKGPNLEAALDFTTFLADPYNYNVTLSGSYTAPVYKNQVGSISTPQYMEAERLIENLFYNSIAWSRVKGFSQMDAKYIQNYMQGTCTLDECLRDMDTARIERAGFETKPVSQ